MGHRETTVIERATEVLGSEDIALEWVDKKSATLGDTPRKIAALSDDGMNKVLLHLNSISRHRLG